MKIYEDSTYVGNHDDSAWLGGYNCKMHTVSVKCIFTGMPAVSRSLALDMLSPMTQFFESRTALQYKEICDTSLHGQSAIRMSPVVLGQESDAALVHG